MRLISAMTSLMVALLIGPFLATGWNVPVASAVTTDDMIVLDKGVAYGEVDGESLLLDIYRPADRDYPRPAVILIHGGPKWSQAYSDRGTMRVQARALAREGYVVFAIDYRLVEVRLDETDTLRNRWPAQLDDVQRAVRWVRANAARYRVDPTRLCAFGSQAGAHLAAMLGVRETRDNADPALADFSSRVGCVVDLAGDMDLTIPYPSDYDQELVTDFLGGPADKEPAAYRDASPLSWVDAATAPFLIIHGGQDSGTPLDHSRRMVEALHKAGVEVIYAEFPDSGHMGAPHWDLVGPWTLAFLERHLHPDL